MRHKQFLHRLDDFLTRVVEGPVRRSAQLDLMLMKRQGLVGEVEAGGSLGCSNHEIVAFRIRQESGRAVSRIAALEFRRDNCLLQRPT